MPFSVAKLSCYCNRATRILKNVQLITDDGTRYAPSDTILVCQLPVVTITILIGVECGNKTATDNSSISIKIIEPCTGGLRRSCSLIHNADYGRNILSFAMFTERMHNLLLLSDECKTIGENCRRMTRIAFRQT